MVEYTPEDGEWHDPYVSVSKVFQEGVTMPNSCGRAKSETMKGKLVIFAEKSSLWKLFQK